MITIEKCPSLVSLLYSTFINSDYQEDEAFVIFTSIVKILNIYQMQALNEYLIYISN